MEVDDNFLIPTEDPKKMRQKVAVSANRYRTRHGRRFKTKTLRIDDGYAVLVTRVE